MIHKIMDKIDRVIAQERESGELDAWLSNGTAHRYCRELTESRKHYYPALLLYVERHAGNG